MSIARAKCKTASARLPDLDRQIAEAKTVLRQLRDALEDLDDHRALARARKRNAGKPGTNWEAVKKELGFKF
jgi:hypothetical protein